MNDLLTREEFSYEVIERDHFKCVICGTERNLTAHHIIDRSLFADSEYSYQLDNGVTLCPEHHLQAERTQISCKELRKLAGILDIVLPEHLDTEEEWDHWGNIVLHSGARLRGEKFYQENVQKALKEGDVLASFLPYVKYPRTYHLPSSPNLQNDDRKHTNVDKLMSLPIVVSIKEDGENCLSATTMIDMMGGSRQSIRKIVKNKMIGSYALGRDEFGNIVPSKIKSVFKNGVTEDWVQISIRKPNGGPPLKIYSTPNHKFFTKDRGWVPASTLSDKDEVLYNKKQIGMTEVQKQVLIGKVFGDGSIHVHYDNSALIQYSHKKEHTAYINYTKTLLGEVQGDGSIDLISGFGTNMSKVWTKCTHSIYKYFIRFLDSKGSKYIPPCIIEDVTPLSIAIWYMDDGNLVHSSKQRDRMQFSTCGFNEESCKVLICCLKKFGIESNYKVFNSYGYIRVNADNTVKLAKLISKYICEVMRYKLPKEFRDDELYIPEKENKKIEYHTLWCKVVTVANKSHQINRIRYDLETETHNYFANGVLVHNCTLYPDYIHARSIDSKHHESRAWVKSLHGKIKHELPEGYRICGENLYAKHSIHYKHLRDHFYVFSIWNEKNEALSWSDTVGYCDILGLQTVPVICKGGGFTLEQIHEEYESYCANSPDPVEGYVIRYDGVIPYHMFKTLTAKYVRENHVQTSKFWMKEIVVPNILESGPIYTESEMYVLRSLLLCYEEYSPDTLFLISNLFQDLPDCCMDSVLFKYRLQKYIDSDREYLSRDQRWSNAAVSKELKTREELYKAMFCPFNEVPMSMGGQFPHICKWRLENGK